jgi:hypothetical protein
MHLAQSRFARVGGDRVEQQMRPTLETVLDARLVLAPARDALDDVRESDRHEHA